VYLKAINNLKLSLLRFLCGPSGICEGKIWAMLIDTSIAEEACNHLVIFDKYNISFYKSRRINLSSAEK
jgi:hypothetical protein